MEILALPWCHDIQAKSIPVLCLFLSCSSHYARKGFPDSDLILFGYGELVVAKFSGTKQWCRARVVGRDSDHNVKVILEIFHYLSGLHTSATALTWCYQRVHFLFGTCDIQAPAVPKSVTS
jgi:hypothetical protein